MLLSTAIIFAPRYISFFVDTSPIPKSITVRFLTSLDDQISFSTFFAPFHNPEYYFA